MISVKEKREKRKRRHKRVRSRVKGTPERPRLCVFRSHKHIYAQIIDDTRAHTLLSASDLELKNSKSGGSGKIEKAFEVGKLIAKKAKEKGISKVVFDRAGYKFHGRVKALAEGAREGGLEF